MVKIGLEIKQDGLKVILKPKTKIELLKARIYLPLDEGKYYWRSYYNACNRRV